MTNLKMKCIGGIIEKIYVIRYEENSIISYRNN